MKELANIVADLLDIINVDHINTCGGGKLCHICNFTLPDLRRRLDMLVHGHD